jgi:hypothetical protein
MKRVDPRGKSHPDDGKDRAHIAESWLFGVVRPDGRHKVYVESNPTDYKWQVHNIPLSNLVL